MASGGALRLISNRYHDRPTHLPVAVPALLSVTATVIIMSSLDLHSLFGVKGKTVLITGGSRGIGKMVRLPHISRGCVSGP